jgi:hypothetical protein
LSYLIFSQDSSPAPDSQKLAASAARFFGTVLEFTEPENNLVRVRLRSAREAVWSPYFAIRWRSAEAADLVRARTAEDRGRAGGMAALAAKCESVWEIEAEPGYEALVLCGICASVALGPVLPKDDSTLFGVRGAVERSTKYQERK